MSNFVQDKYEEFPAYKMVTTSNIISFVRGILAIPIIYLLYKGKGGWAFVFMMIGAVSDVLDGWLARAGNQITALGKVIDPIADKVLMNSILLFLVLVREHSLPLEPYFGLLLIRDFSISFFAIYILNTRKFYPGANKLGKASILITAIAILSFIYPDYFSFNIQLVLYWVSAVFMVLSWGKYFYKFIAIIRETEPEKKAEEVKETEERKKGKDLEDGLAKTEQSIASKLPLIRKFVTIDNDVLEDIEETLISTDMGVDLTEHLVDKLRDVKKSESAQLKEILKAEIKNLISHEEVSVEELEGNPHVILFVGVNGTGKTTTIGKLSHKYAEEGKNVMIAAADTYRAAAFEQLKIWSERSNVDFMGNPEGKDPAAVAFDAVKSADAKDKDILMIDTAGRLHTKSNLMQELQKIERVCSKAKEGTPQDVWLVLDGTTGQNGIRQAEKFAESVDVSGLILTKLDGTAKGGAVLAIHNKMNIPIKYIGIGEELEDIVEFDPDEYIEALLK